MLHMLIRPHIAATPTFHLAHANWNLTKTFYRETFANLTAVMSAPAVLAFLCKLETVS